MKKLLLLLLVISVAGCKPLMLKYYGIKDPSFKTEKQIKRYLVKKDIDTTASLYPKNLQAWGQIGKLGMPQAYFFNAKGEYVNYKKSASDCNAKVDSFIGDLKNLNNEPSQKDFTITQMFDRFNAYNGKLPETSGYDGYVVITWATYLGKLNKDKSFEWLSSLDKAKASGLKIQYYLVNGDLQEKWGLTEDQKNEFEIN